MKNAKWGNLVVGLGLVLLLAAFILLASRRAAWTVPVPAEPVAIATLSTTASSVITVGQILSPAQASLVVTVLPASVITFTTTTTESNRISAQWQQFSSKISRYTLLYPPNSTVSSLKLLPTTVEHTQITLPSSSDGLGIFINIRVYDNSSGNSIEAFLAELYKQVYREVITGEKLHSLLSRPLDIASTKGYAMDLLVGSTEMQILIPHKNYFYLFILGHNFGPVNSSAQDIEKFTHMVNTINFE